MAAANDSPELNAQADAQAGLLAAMARGEKAALAGLYDSLAKPLYSLAYRVTNDATEAQDIIQDVFLQLWHKAADYHVSRGSVFSWAATLTRNRAIDRVRMRKRRAEILAESAGELQPAAPAGDTDSAGSLWAQEKAGAVRAALTRLAPEQQKAIELAYFSGLTQQEIAARLNEPLGTIKARIRRGLLQLRQSLPAHL
ncbi:MAG: sigma-70 family RNA polymerase sigma factor [Lacunisphaera sp.]|nr:sigma-70 family RNA polymerase sigma factor [Lacunisphaera sp.]